MAQPIEEKTLTLSLTLPDLSNPEESIAKTYEVSKTAVCNLSQYYKGLIEDCGDDDETPYPIDSSTFYIKEGDTVPHKASFTIVQNVIDFINEFGDTVTIPDPDKDYSNDETKKKDDGWDLEQFPIDIIDNMVNNKFKDPNDEMEMFVMIKLANFIDIRPLWKLIRNWISKESKKLPVEDQKDMWRVGHKYRMIDLGRNYSEIIVKELFNILGTDGDATSLVADLTKDYDDLELSKAFVKCFITGNDTIIDGDGVIEVVDDTEVDVMEALVATFGGAIADILINEKTTLNRGRAVYKALTKTGGDVAKITNQLIENLSKIERPEAAIWSRTLAMTLAKFDPVVIETKEDKDAKITEVVEEGGGGGGAAVTTTA